MIKKIRGGTVLLLCLLALPDRQAAAQTYGIDLHNVSHPASGGMAGVSLANPQDAPSALYGNPSTMTQFSGTVVTMGLSWLAPTLDVTHDGSVTGAMGGGPWSGTSEMQGLLNPSIAVIQDLSSLGIDGNAGLGLTAGSGLGTSFRSEPASLGATAEYVVYEINAGLALDITEQLSAGAAFTLGMGFLDAGFVSTSAMTHAYGSRGTFGLDYDVAPETILGVFYQTRMPFTFNNQTTSTPGVFTDTKIEQPDNVGVGISNQSLFGGNLLLAVDVIYKQWEGAEFWQDYYVNQWVYALGGQYTQGNLKYRAGYAYANNPIDKHAGQSAGPAAHALTQYLQATELAAISKHRLTAGIGYSDLIPGVDLDLYAGGLLPETEKFGTHSRATAFAWYAGVGLTWRFDAAIDEPPM